VNPRLCQSSLTPTARPWRPSPGEGGCGGGRGGGRWVLPEAEAVGPTTRSLKGEEELQSSPVQPRGHTHLSSLLHTYNTTEEVKDFNDQA